MPTKLWQYFFLIAQFYISSVTETVKPKFMILQVEDILKFLKDFQHKYSKAQQS